MQDLTIKKIEEKHSKDGKSTFYAVFGEGGEEMTTFDAAIYQLQTGSIISVEPKVSGKYINIEKWELKQDATAQPPSSSGNGKDMPPEYWEKKQRIERESIESQTAIKAVPELLALDITKISDGEKKLYFKALDWCGAKIDANMGRQHSEPKATNSEARGAAIEGVPNFETGIDLVNYALKNGYTIGRVRKDLSIDSPTDIKDVPAATAILFPKGE